MTLEPLLAAPLATQIHAFVAIGAFVIGIIQLSRAKGDGAHRALGYAWVAMMMVIAASSFRIHHINQWHGFSWIHLLSILVLVNAPLAVMHARGGNIRRHKLSMIGLFVGALLVAGAFTFLPGRIMHAVAFGPQ
ncbi:MAG: DUF2306 domain-containing protein [Hyphomicrobiaceae bacterium]